MQSVPGEMTLDHTVVLQQAEVSIMPLTQGGRCLSFISLYAIIREGTVCQGFKVKLDFKLTVFYVL